MLWGVGAASEAWGSFITKKAYRKGVDMKQSLHITELTEDLIQELKEYIEINQEGHILTKKKNLRQNPLTGVSGDTKTQINKRRGCKTEYGQLFAFTFPSTRERLTAKAREVAWVMNYGTYSPSMKVKPKNGNLFDDRIENLHLVRDKNGRPPKKRDSKIRMKRDSLNHFQEKEVVAMRKKGLTINSIAEDMNSTSGVIKKVLKDRKEVKPFFNINQAVERVDFKKEQIGVYAIYASPLDSKKYIQKALIGSSRNIQKRTKQHLALLNSGRHYNQELQSCYDSGEYKFNCFILEAGFFDHGMELAKETEHINRWEPVSLFNTWSQPSLVEIKPYLDKAKHILDDETRYTVDENGCWNWNIVKHRCGYSKEIQVYLNSKIKHIKPHRLSYYKAYGEYPELVRHMCDNRVCVNPDHLKKGSHRQNGLDKSRQFRKDFEHWWIHYKGDVEKLTNHFDFKKNQNLGSSQIYYWEKQIGLREKYPDICPNRELNKPTEQSIRRSKERLERVKAKEARKKFVESFREKAVSLKRRYYATQAELASYLNLTLTEVRSLVKGVKYPIDNLQEDMTVFNKIFKPYTDRGLYHEEQHRYVSKMIEDFPEHKSDIEDHFAKTVFRDESERFSMFRVEFHRNRVSRAH